MTDAYELGPEGLVQDRDSWRRETLEREKQAQAKRIKGLEREQKVLADFYWAVRRGEKPDVENPVLFAAGQEEEEDE